jgi:peroxiredoxin 2/4
MKGNAKKEIGVKYVSLFVIMFSIVCLNAKASLVLQKAPDFTAKAVMEDNSIEELTLSDYEGDYVVLFFYPYDFSFVCPTEIIAFDEAVKEFEKRDAQLIGISTDSEFVHFAWKTTFRDEGGIGHINYPLVADVDKSISKAYGVLHEGKAALRGLFIINRDGIVHHELVNDMDLGRKVDNVLNVLDGLQYIESHAKMCPANWEEGDDGIEANKESVIDHLNQ